MKDAPHAKLGLLHGFYCYQEWRSLCEVRGVGPNQWLVAAKGFGFHVHTICYKDEEFKHIINDSGPPPSIFKWGHYKLHQLHPNLAVVFSGVASLPEVGSGWY